MKLPLAVEYDDSHKRLFVADSWNNRVLVYDMTPGQVESGMPASYVLGQRDFESYEPMAARNRISFGSRDGHGHRPLRRPIGGNCPWTESTSACSSPTAAITVYWSSTCIPTESGTARDAIAVLGQDDFTTTEIGLSATRWNLPGDLVFDENHQRLFVEVPFQNRVLVFDARAEQLSSGQAASLVIGQSRLHQRRSRHLQPQDSPAGTASPMTRPTIASTSPTRATSGYWCSTPIRIAWRICPRPCR